MLKCDGCGNEQASEVHLYGQFSHADMNCKGVWREVKAEAQSVDPDKEQRPDTIARHKKAIAYLEETIAKLREENARLKTFAETETTDALRAQEEVKRLKMELADLKSASKAVAIMGLQERDELEFCKNELYRLNPRLAAARWGKRG
jgi:chromosome segregation ATPase